MDAVARAGISPSLAFADFSLCSSTPDQSCTNEHTPEHGVTYSWSCVCHHQSDWQIIAWNLYQGLSLGLLGQTVDFDFDISLCQIL